MIERLNGETEEQFLWRLGQSKDNGTIDLNWSEIADILNKEFRDDETDYLGESAYRKSYQYAKRFFDAGVFNSYNDDKYVEELRVAKHELRKEKQKLFDERTALNKTLRENARVEEDLSKLKELIINNGTTTLPYKGKEINFSDNDLIITLSDFHLGMDVDNYFGSYNAEVAAERLSNYLKAILEIKEKHNSESAFLFLMGDLVNGSIHYTTQLENRENVVEQVQKSAELISAFIYDLSNHFTNVIVNGVAGNHSRISFKDQVLRHERLDNLIPWYMKAKLGHLENVEFVDKSNIDPTIGYCFIRGNKYLLVHGDFDSFSESGVSKLVMMLGYKPKAVFYGHFHRCSLDEYAGVKLIRSGSFSGSVDDNTVSKRLNGKASQMVCVVTNDGIESLYPVELN